MKFHPAASVFPLMGGNELSALVASIRNRGLVNPIEIVDEMVIDGRNRFRAAGLADVVLRPDDFVYLDLAVLKVTPTQYVVSKNIDKHRLTQAQKAVLALDVTYRLDDELPGKGHKALQREAARLVGCGTSSIDTVRLISKRDEDGKILDDIRAGKLNLAQAARAAGFERLGQGSGGAAAGALDKGDRTADGKAITVAYGRGDLWVEASEPLVRYLAGQKRRGYNFSHLNPREAGKRVETIDVLIKELQAARADLEPRSIIARAFGGS